jgi:hypothetical protein
VRSAKIARLAEKLRGISLGRSTRRAPDVLGPQASVLPRRAVETRWGRAVKVASPHNPWSHWAKLSCRGPTPFLSFYFPFLFLIYIFPFHLSSNFKLKFFGKFSSDLKSNIEHTSLTFIYNIYFVYIFLFSNSFPPPSIILWGFVFQNRI